MPVYGNGEHSRAVSADPDPVPSVTPSVGTLAGCTGLGGVSLQASAYNLSARKASSHAGSGIAVTRNLGLIRSGPGFATRCSAAHCALSGRIHARAAKEHG